MMEVDTIKPDFFTDYVKALFGELEESQREVILKTQEQNNVSKKSMVNPCLRFSTFCTELKQSQLTKMPNLYGALLDDLKMASSWFEIQDPMIMNDKLSKEFQKFNEFKDILDLYIQYFHASKSPLKLQNSNIKSQFLVRLILSFEIQCLKPDGVSDEIEIDSDTPLLTIANQMNDVEEGIKLLHTGYDSSKSFTNKYFLDIDILKQVSTHGYNFESFP